MKTCSRSFISPIIVFGTTALLALFIACVVFFVEPIDKEADYVSQYINSGSTLPVISQYQ